MNLRLTKKHKPNKVDTSRKRLVSLVVDSITDFGQKISLVFSLADSLLFSNFVFNHGISLFDKRLSLRSLGTSVNEFDIILLQEKYQKLLQFSTFVAF